VLPHALPTPVFNKLFGKRVVLASASPRRKEILNTYGLNPEVIPSTFVENLSKDDFPNIYEYPVSTATEKAVEVYERLVQEQPNDAPDLVIAADTIVITRPTPPTSDIAPSLLPHTNPEVLEKPGTKEENFRMLLDLNGQQCEVVTGISIVYPILTAPGFQIKSLDERSIVQFSNNPKHLLEAYVDSGEGIDRAGGFAVQGLGGLLVAKIDGDFWNVVGFPAASFFKFLDLLIEEDDGFLDV